MFRFSNSSEFLRSPIAYILPACATLDITTHTTHFGFLVDTPEIRALIDETTRLRVAIADDAARVDALRPAFAALLAADGWLPDSCAQPDDDEPDGRRHRPVRALSRRRSVALSLLARRAGRRRDAGSRSSGVGPGRHLSRAAGRNRLPPPRRRQRSGAGAARGRRSASNSARGEFYTLLPPADDIHYVTTISDTPSISIHLLANDTACVWRHKFEPATGVVTPFRSGYANAPCPPRLDRTGSRFVIASHEISSRRRSRF